MKDTTPEHDSSGLTPCSLSFQCVRLLDEEDEELSLHLRSCETCIVAVAAARKRREQQRLALSRFLAEGEKQVPSTTATILAAMRKEPGVIVLDGETRRHYRDTDNIRMHLTTKERPPQAKRHFGSWLFLLSTLSAVAVAAVVFVIATNVFLPYLHLNAGQNTVSLKDDTKTQLSSAGLKVSTNWTSVVAVSKDTTTQSITFYDVTKTKQAPQTFLCCNIEAKVDGIAHYGNDLISRSYNEQAHTTEYRLLSGKHFMIPGEGTNAVWSLDDTDSKQQRVYVFVANTEGGMWKVDVQQATLPSEPLSKQDPHHTYFQVKATELAFTRRYMLYFYQNNTLLQLDTRTADAQPRVLLQGISTAAFGLDPLNNTVYYTQLENGIRNVYTLDEDLQTRKLAENASMVGYAPDYAPLLIRQNSNGNFDLLKVNTQTNAESIVYENLANGASALCVKNVPRFVPICEENIAASPDGSQLMFVAEYKDGKQQLLLVNWVQQTTTPVVAPVLQNDPQEFRLIGWSKFSF